MATLTLKRKKQVFVVNGGKIVESIEKSEKATKKPKPIAQEKADETCQLKKKKSYKLKPADPTKIPPLIQQWPKLFMVNDDDLSQ